MFDYAAIGRWKTISKKAVEKVTLESQPRNRAPTIWWCETVEDRFLEYVQEAGVAALW